MLFLKYFLRVHSGQFFICVSENGTYKHFAGCSNGLLQSKWEFFAKINGPNFMLTVKSLATQDCCDCFTKQYELKIKHIAHWPLNVLHTAWYTGILQTCCLPKNVYFYKRSGSEVQMH